MMGFNNRPLLFQLFILDCPCPSNADLFKGKRGGKIISGEHTWLVLDRDLLVVVGGEVIVEGAFFVSLDFGRVE